MRRFPEDLAKSLGVKLPKEYVHFMEKYGKKLPDDPISDKSRIAGLGNDAFVIGTTEAFRARIPHFPIGQVVIGYSGVKSIVLNRTYETIDTFVALDTRDGKVLEIDTLGAVETIADSFEDWIGPELLISEFKEKFESTLTVVLFDDRLKAEEACSNLMKLQLQGYIGFEETVVVVKKADGIVKHYHTHQTAQKGAASQSITGLARALLELPVLGSVLGAVTGALSAAPEDAGIDDDFIKKLSANFKPGTSALFALLDEVQPDKVLEAFRGFGGKVFVTSIIREKAAMLQACLDAAQENAEKGCEI
ncbi:MAG: DUF1269 domain-containing protein [Syntrophobacteraceae bacterium]